MEMTSIKKRPARRRRQPTLGEPESAPKKITQVAEVNPYGVWVMHVFCGKKELGRMYKATLGGFMAYRSDYEDAGRVETVEEGVKFLQRKAQ